MPEHSPLKRLINARKTARLAHDPAARYCTLATVEKQSVESGAPQVRTRTVVLREVTETACLLYVNRDSQKNLSSPANTSVELLLFYPSSMMQFRVRGTVSLMDETELKDHWQRKPYEAKLLDHYYARYQPQSSTLESRDVLQRSIEALKATYPDPNTVPFSDNALGIYVHANYLETWKVQENGLHKRKLYKLDEDSAGEERWQSVELVP